MNPTDHRLVALFLCQPVDLSRTQPFDQMGQPAIPAQPLVAANLRVRSNCRITASARSNTAPDVETVGAAAATLGRGANRAKGSAPACGPSNDRTNELRSAIVDRVELAAAVRLGAVGCAPSTASCPLSVAIRIARSRSPPPTGRRMIAVTSNRRMGRCEHALDRRRLPARVP
jgi:hypothetical protein